MNVFVSMVAGFIVGFVGTFAFLTLKAKRREKHKKQQSRKFRWWELT